MAVRLSRGESSYEAFELRGVEADLTCSVCLEIFDEPKTLPCGHSFCEACVSQLLRRTKERHLTCPKCKSQHNKVIVDQLAINKRLKLATAPLRTEDSTAAILAENPTTPKLLKTSPSPSKLVLMHRMQSKGLFLSEEVLAVTLLTQNLVCFSTVTGIHCHKTNSNMKSAVVWKKDLKDISSLTSNLTLMFGVQYTATLIMENGAYSSWVIHVLDFHGVQLRRLYGGLGLSCSLSALPSGCLAIADTGNYRHHAQACIILMTDRGDDRRVLKTQMSHDRLIRPTAVLGTPYSGQLLLFDAGDRHLKCYSTTSKHLRLRWKLMISRYVNITTDIHKLNPSLDASRQQDCRIIVLVKDGIKVLDSGSGRTLCSVDMKWSRGLPRDVGLTGSILGVSTEKEVLLYQIAYERGEQDEVLQC